MYATRICFNMLKAPHQTADPEAPDALKVLGVVGLAHFWPRSLFFYILYFLEKSFIGKVVKSGPDVDLSLQFQRKTLAHFLAHFSKVGHLV